MPDPRSTLREDVHFRVMRLLQENSEMSQRDLAEEVGISLGRVHYVLRALIDKGFVKLGKFRFSNDKRRYAYVLTSRGAAEKAAMTHRFLAHKMKEYAALKAEIEALSSEVEGPVSSLRDER